MISTYKLDFNIGETVYLQTDPDGLMRLVVEISITPSGTYYMLACGSEVTSHYGFEITRDKPVHYLIDRN